MTAAVLGTTVVTTAAGNKTITATPTLGDMILIIACNTGRTTAQAPTITDNNSGNPGRYSQVNTCTKNTSADSMWAFIRGGRVTSGTSTVFTMATASDSGGGLVVFRITGMTLGSLPAVRQSGIQSNQAAAGTPAPAFGGAALTANPCFSAVFNATNTSAMTQPTSWTADIDQGYNTPTTGFRAAFISSGFTGSTVTWGSTSGSAFCSIAVELTLAQGNLDVTYPPARKPQQGAEVAVLASTVW